MKQSFVYIMASKKNGVLYTGVTVDLMQRVYQHKNDVVECFTKKYHIHKLVYYEKFDYIRNAIEREKQIKKWRRLWKIELIEKFNPDWDDLFDERFSEIAEFRSPLSRG